MSNLIGVRVVWQRVEKGRGAGGRNGVKCQVGRGGKNRGGRPQVSAVRGELRWREVKRVEADVRRRNIDILKGALARNDITGAVAGYGALPRGEGQGVLEEFVKAGEGGVMVAGRVLQLAGDGELALDYYKRYFNAEGGLKVFWDEVLYYYASGNREMGEKLFDHAMWRLKMRVTLGFITELYELGKEFEALIFLDRMHSARAAGDNRVGFARAYLSGSRRSDMAIMYVQRVPVSRLRDVVMECEYMIERGAGGQARGRARSILDDLKKGEGFDDVLSALDLVMITGSSEDFNVVVKEMCEGDFASSKLKAFTRGKPSRLDMLRNVSLQCSEDTDTIEGLILSKVKVDPDFKNRAFLGGVDLGAEVKKVVMELKEKGGIVKDILQAVCVYAKYEPRFSIDLYDYDEGTYWAQKGEFVAGQFCDKNKRVSMATRLSMENFGPILIHELTHLVLGVLYGNKGNPYKSGRRARDERTRCMQVSKHFEELKPGEDDDEVLVAKRFAQVKELSVYDNDNKHGEYVARYVEHFGGGHGGKDYFHKLVKPMDKFWNKFVEPRLRRYLESHSADIVD